MAQPKRSAQRRTAAALAEDLGHARKAGLHIGPVKTRAGERDLPLLGLAEQVLATIEQGSRAASDLVFTSSAGHPIEPTNFVRSFQVISKQADLPRIKLHHLRHTTATLLKDAGVPARDAQLILGHSQTSITQQIYQHDNLDSRRKSLGEIEKVFLRSSDGSSSRHSQPSKAWFVDLVTSVLSGGPSWSLSQLQFLGQQFYKTTPPSTKGL